MAIKHLAEILWMPADGRSQFFCSYAIFILLHFAHYHVKINLKEAKNMTIQSKRLLRKLKKAQETADNTIYIDYEQMTAVTVHTEGSDFTTVKLRRYKDSIHSILNYLKKLGYVDYDDFGNVQVLHPGWSVVQTDVSNFIDFLYKSVLVPIAISIATTVLLSYLQRIMG